MHRWFFVGILVILDATVVIHAARIALVVVMYRVLRDLLGPRIGRLVRLTDILRRRWQLWGQKEDWSSGNVEGTPFSKYQLAQINPFDDRVCGVKIPDSNTYPSIAIYCNDD